MKSYFQTTCLAVALLWAVPACAQSPTSSLRAIQPAPAPPDFILLRNGDEVAAHVEEVLPDSIRYYRADNLQGPLFTILRTEVFRIRYANGTRDVFEEPGAGPALAGGESHNYPGFGLDASRLTPTGALPRLGHVFVPDSIQNNALSSHYFEQGRYLGQAAFRNGSKGSWPAPALTANLLPDAPDARERADAAYRLGYRRQFERDRATRADVIGGVLGIGLGFLGLLLSVAAASSQ